MDYSKMTNDDFEKHLLYVLDGMTPNDFLSIPGVYEIVAEYFNNDILESWAEDQEDQEDEDES